MKQILQKLQAELDARGHGACVDNNSRMIVHDDRNIYLYLKESGMTEYVSYTPELYYLLASPRFCSFSYKYEMGRAMVELMPYYKSGRRYKRHLGTVLLQWYKHGNTPGMVSPSIWSGAGRSNSTVMFCPVSTSTTWICRICSPLKMDGNTVRAFSGNNRRCRRGNRCRCRWQSSRCRSRSGAGRCR